MRRLLALLVLTAAVFAAALGTASSGDAYGYNCAIQDPPPAPYRVGSYLYGSTKTICASPVAKLAVVVCLVRYNTYSGTGAASRGCAANQCYGCVSVTAIADAFCNYTTYPYVWRVSSYAVATLTNGQTYKSPSVLSNAYVQFCA